MVVLGIALGIYVVIFGVWFRAFTVQPKRLLEQQKHYYFLVAATAYVSAAVFILLVCIGASGWLSDSVTQAQAYVACAIGFIMCIVAVGVLQGFNNRVVGYQLKFAKAA